MAEDSYENNSEKDEEDSTETNATSPPAVGEVFTCELQKINSSGNGVISDDLGGLNIGPIDDNIVGKEIKILKITESYGICLTEMLFQMIIQHLFIH